MVAFDSASWATGDVGPEPEFGGKERSSSRKRSLYAAFRRLRSGFRFWSAAVPDKGGRDSIEPRPHSAGNMVRAPSLPAWVPPVLSSAVLSPRSAPAAPADQDGV